MIDSLDPNAQELPVALGMLRTRIQPVLNSRNVALVWDVEGLPDTLVLRPCMTLSILRILQESIANVIKHSVASTIQLGINLIDHITGKGLCIRIWEDGKGFDPTATGGRGLLNIRHRITDLRGSVRYSATDNGFEIRIFIPVDATNAS